MLSRVINKHFFGIVLAVLMLAEIFSLAGYALPPLNWALLVLITLGVSYLYAKDKQWLVYLPLIEVFWGSLGRSFYWDIGGFNLSLRMLIFGLTILWWLPQSRTSLRAVNWHHWLSRLYIIIIVLMVFGVIVGLWNHNALSNIFFDANGYTFWLYYLIWYPLIPKCDWKKITAIFLASAVIVSVKTLLIFHLFTHLYDWANITFLYLWVRDTKVGELTLVTANYWRIFFQSHLFPALVWLMSVVYLVVSPQVKWSFKTLLLSALSLSAILISLSRSFWLALIVTIIIIKVVNLKKIWLQPQKKIRIGLFLSSILVAALLLAVTLFVPPVDSELISAFGNRFSTGESAASSRANLVPVMIQGIKQHWLVGAGFGSTLTYKNNDPRIRDLANPDGTYTTYAFELGWLDIWFKFGLLGLLAWAGLIGYCLYYGWRLSQRATKQSTEIICLTAGLLFIALTHSITPYLNHPLGLSYLILFMLFIQHYEPKATTNY